MLFSLSVQTLVFLAFEFEFQQASERHTGKDAVAGQSGTSNDCPTVRDYTTNFELQKESNWWILYLVLAFSIPTSLFAWTKKGFFCRHVFPPLKLKSTYSDQISNR